MTSTYFAIVHLSNAKIGTFGKGGGHYGKIERLKNNS